MAVSVQNSWLIIPARSPSFLSPPPVPPEMQLYVVCRLFTHHELQGADKANLAEVPLTDPFCARRGNDVSGNLRGS